MKSDFINVASHELRTPLTSLEMGVNLLLEGAAGALTPKQKEVVTMCRDDTERLDRLVKELLNLSRIESGETPPQLGDVPAAELVVAAVQPLRRQVDAKGLTLQVQADAGLPPVAVDRRQIERVHRQPRHQRDPCDGSWRRPRRLRRPAWRIRRRLGPRHGPGHPARISQPDPRAVRAGAGGARRAEPASGLSISRRIVQAHGGQLSVRSEPGRGTTFTFTVPTAYQSVSDPGRTRCGFS